MGTTQIVRCFLFVDTAKHLDRSGLRQGTLTFVKEDGSTHTVECTIGKRETLLKGKGEEIGLLSSLHLSKKDLCLGVKKEILSELEGALSSSTEGHGQLTVMRYNDFAQFNKGVRGASDKAFSAYFGKIDERKKEEELSTKLKARVIHVITGTLATPLEIASGVIRLALACAALAAVVLPLLAFKAAKAISSGRVTWIHIAEKAVRDFFSFALYEVRIALLQLVPIIGAQLVNQYKATGSLKGFIDAPAVGALLAKIGLGAAQVVYGTSSRRHLKMSSERVKLFWKGVSPHMDVSYLSKKRPTVEDARKVIESVPQEKESVLVRIPVKTEKGEARYHDGTLLFTSKRGAHEISAPTVIMYHGRRGHRDSLLKAVQPFLDTGYNVLLGSYAGDCVIQGNGKTYKEVATSCTEALMKEDAQADADFLHSLGVRKIQIYGFSLGGAQAMNCATAVPGGVFIESIFLNKTFSHAEAVVERAAKNGTKSPLLAQIVRSFARRFFLEERKEKELGEYRFLDNETKLKDIVKSRKCEATIFNFEGGVADTLMADRRDPRINFARDLYEIVVSNLGAEEAQKRAFLRITDKAHVL